VVLDAQAATPVYISTLPSQIAEMITQLSATWAGEPGVEEDVEIGFRAGDGGGG
jgi:hypothetical protein